VIAAMPECTPEDAAYYATKPRCALCGIGIGPDITGRPMCYGCGGREMRPALWTLPHNCDGKCVTACDPRSRFTRINTYKHETPGEYMERIKHPLLEKLR
jgi:hypothetical protein